MFMVEIPSDDPNCILLANWHCYDDLHPSNNVCPRFAPGYPFPDGIPPPGAVFNGFRPPIPGAMDPTRPLPPGLVAGKP